MTGKTHLAVGEASAFLLLQPSTAKELVLLVGAAAVGALICDVDSTYTKSHRAVHTLTILSLISIAVTVFLELQYHMGIWNMLLRQTHFLHTLVCFLLALLVCNYGMNQPHRSFMHSFPALILLSVLVWQAFPPLLYPFSIAMLSHIAIDLLNRQGLLLFYPFSWSLCFKVCSASGHINDLFCFCGSAAAGVGFLLALCRIFL